MEFKETLQEVLRRSIMLQDPGVRIQPKVVAQLAQANTQDLRVLLDHLNTVESVSETPQEIESRLRDARARFLLCGSPTH